MLRVRVLLFGRVMGTCLQTFLSHPCSLYCMYYEMMGGRRRLSSDPGSTSESPTPTLGLAVRRLLYLVRPKRSMALASRGASAFDRIKGVVD